MFDQYLFFIKKRICEKRKIHTKNALSLESLMIALNRSLTQVLVSISDNFMLAVKHVSMKIINLYLLLSISQLTNLIVCILPSFLTLVSIGTQWRGFTDHVMGGLSQGTLSREEVEGKMSNVLRGHGMFFSIYSPLQEYFNF